MNKLRPELKQLLAVARRTEEISENEIEGPSRRLVARVLRESAATKNPVEPGLLEFMVQRAAGISAVVGAAIFALQYTGGGAALSSITQSLTRGATFLRAFLP